MQTSDALGFAVAAVLGVVALVIVGYLVYAAPGDAMRFEAWLQYPFKFGAAKWAICGLFVGTAVRYLSLRR